MKILVIGSGGREHALAWKLAKSEKVERVYAAPGNGGTAAEEKCENVELWCKSSAGQDTVNGDPAKEETQEALISFVKKEGIDLTVVGPEAPLAAGIADRFRAAGLSIVGPGAAASRLEASKAYAKSLMEKYGVRRAQSVTYDTPMEIHKALQIHYGNQNKGSISPLVIKADGLAAGKGVAIAEDLNTAETTVNDFMEKGILGDAGKVIVLEEFLRGPEVSILAAVSVSGGRGIILPFVAARDHKRRYDHDQGPNTGGMGAIAPVPDFTADLFNDFETAILNPTLQGLLTENYDYRGFIFFGVLVQNGKCYLLEYNIRLGDPETQAVLPLMDSDFAGLCRAIENGTLGEFRLSWKPGAVCAPVAVASGYPGDYQRGDPITVNKTAFAGTGAVFFAAGAVRGPGNAAEPDLYSAGGRVLAVSAHGVNGADARERAYKSLEAVHFEGMDYRQDIGTNYC
ncbi:MAG: phosphoribosylamine--glycine ligase [Treponema sp.]|jgi:phosphoribosylamine--glycine ligase|nr:phosphoribosylamine--glycine ligase [Treponema sp.]